MKKLFFTMGAISLLVVLAGCGQGAPKAENEKGGKNLNAGFVDEQVVVLADKKPDLNKAIIELSQIYNNQEFDKLNEILAPQVEQYISLKNTTPEAVIADAKKFFSNKTNVSYNLHLELGDYQARYTTVGDNSIIEYLLNMSWDTVKGSQKISHYDVQVVVEATFDKNNKLIKYLELEIRNPEKIKYTSVAGVKKVYFKDSSPKYEVEANYPQLSFDNKEIQDRVNKKIKSKVDADVAEFKKFVEEMSRDLSADFKSTFNLDYTALYFNDQLVSIIFQEYNEIEGYPHWNIDFVPFNYDIRQDKMLEQSDIFTSNSQSASVLRDLCLQKAQEQINQTMKEYPELTEDDLNIDYYREGCANSTSFNALSLDKNGINFFFAPYVLLPWAAYSQSLDSMHVDYADVLPYLNINGPVKNLLIQHLISKKITIFQHFDGNSYLLYQVKGNDIEFLGRSLPAEGIIAPNEQKLAYVKDDALYLENIDGTDNQKIAEAEWLTPHGMLYQVRWSADSAKIFFGESIGTEGWSAYRSYEYDLNTKEKKTLDEVEHADEYGIDNYVTQKRIHISDQKFSFSYADFDVQPDYLGPNMPINVNRLQESSVTPPKFLNTVNLKDKNGNVDFSVSVIDYKPQSLDTLLKDAWGCGDQELVLKAKKISRLDNGLKYVSIWQADPQDPVNFNFVCILDKEGRVISLSNWGFGRTSEEFEAILLKVLKTVKFD